jgi:hypothetical protein
MRSVKSRPRFWVLLGDGDDEAQVVLDHLGLGALGFVEVLADVAGEVDEARPGRGASGVRSRGCGKRRSPASRPSGADRAADDDGRLDQVAGVFDVALDVRELEPFLEELPS